MASPLDRLHELVGKATTSEPLSAVLTVLGALVLARSALKIVLAVYSSFLRPGKNLRKYGEWAVVTGATGKHCIVTCQLCCFKSS
jgi:hypothetical protein